MDFRITPEQEALKKEFEDFFSGIDKAHVSAVLSADNLQQLYVPAGMLHGFVVTSEFAQMEYKCTGLYAPGAEFSVAWNDPDLAIPWPVDDPALSPKDRDAPRLRDVEDRLAEF